MTRPAAEPGWAARAELMQGSLDRYFGADGTGTLHDWHPRSLLDLRLFNYWWLAHAVEARLDAYERSRDQARLAEAGAIQRRIIARNGGSLFNDYFDDMGWLGIATARLAALAGSADHAGQAEALWRRIRDQGWNDSCGGGVAWRGRRPHFKNTPATGTFIILSALLHELTGRAEYLQWALRALDWLTATLRRADGFIIDGINRAGDGQLDEGWKFTYNQGLYIGACTALAAATGREDLLESALATADAAYAELSPAGDGVLVDPGDGTDDGLFKGIFYRYAAGLALAARPAFAAAARLAATLTLGCEVLWRQALAGGSLLAGPDWRVPPSGRVPLSAQLSAVIATEACARLELLAAR